MTQRKLTRAWPALIVGAALGLSACGSDSDAESAGSGSEGGEKAKRVVLVGNQRFGDQGPMDDMARGLERCKQELGFETKRVESIETAGQEDDIRAIAGQGYDLVFTTFPPMTPATAAVAGEFPDQKFAAVYQFINVEGKSTPNIWDSEYSGDAAYYIAGAMAAKLSKNGSIGFVGGAEDPTINASINAWVRGAEATDASVKTRYAFAGTFEDPAKGKEIALAMSSQGVDVVTTAAAKTQLGVLDAAKSKNMLFIGDVADNAKEYPEGFVGYVGSSFGQNVFTGCKDLADGKFAGGKHTTFDLSNGGYSVPFDKVTAWGKASGREADAKAASDLGKDLEQRLNGGSLKVPHEVKLR